MNNILTAIEDMVSALLSQKKASDAITRNVIYDAVRSTSAIMSSTNQILVTDEDIDLITKRLEARFDITMSWGTLFAEDYRPWLANSRGDVNWYYWDRYKRYLRFPPQVIRSLDNITDQILDHLENPKKEGKWARKGMVVGHVQSGKTANYIGLVNKAADSGYKVIIILAGTLNSLRNQTQFRFDSGFIGKDTELKHLIGVGLFSNEKKPAYFTTNTKDFRKSIANQIGVSIGDLREPVILVIKKHKSTLENLIDWLKHNNPYNLKDYPTLLIDDEADHASINTNKEGDEATTINRKIRELLHLFDRSSYLGYTATPFANVFIDPATESEMLGDDLFPRNFIISLDPPSNYVGSERIFSSEANLDIVRMANDYEDYLPANHKKNWRPEGLPASLQESIQIFVLSRAIRLLRGEDKSHNSMMINVSRFTDVQSHIKLLVDEYVKEIRQSVVNHYKLSSSEALKNSVMAGLKNVFVKEFSQTGHTWSEVQKTLKESVSPIDVIEVNSSSAAEKLDYSEQNYPQGRNVIAVGGLGLSRGLTLEGLTVSYFLRNSIMYDTLMQMGRWFGYRDGYEDLCRIYMTAEAFSWYAHISDATEELRQEFKRMKAAGMSPKDFGLCVRSHPESLIVTARNKMRTGISVLRQVSLVGRLVETSVLLKPDDALKFNRNLLDSTVEEMLNINAPLPVDHKLSGYLWSGIPVDIIKGFIENFRNHPASQLTDSRPLKGYIIELEKSGMSFWDVVLISPQKGNPKPVKDLIVNLQIRTVSTSNDRIFINKDKRRVGFAVQESAGLPPARLELAEEQYKIDFPDKKSIPGSVYRKLRGELSAPPLLILHLLDCKEEGDETLFSDGVVAYGISFPGDPGNKRPEKFVEYVVNTTWWKNEYSDSLDEEGEIEDE
jgi:hypothetical protein